MDPRLYPELKDLEKTHWWFVGRRRVLLSALERLRVEAHSVLDVGCGAGTNLDLLARRYGEASIHGIDLERAALHFCRKKRSLPVCQATATRLPYRAGSFDLVAALDALEHVEDDQAALDELFRVCRPGGTLFVTVPAFRFLWGELDELGHHYRRYTRKELLTKVSRAGFSITFVRFFNFLLFPPVAAVRILSRLLPRRGAVAGERPHCDLDIAGSGGLNRLLARIFALEGSLLSLRLPVGVSLMCVARRSGP
jgi:SAM-dependent methyltransferase